MSGTGAASGDPPAGSVSARAVFTRVPSPLVALEFLTVLRLRRPALVSSEALARAQLWYPAVGLVIGACVAGVDRALAGRLAEGPKAAILLMLLCGLPGLLHIDGLADAADGLLAPQSRERRLEIMRDSRTGSFGIAAIGVYLVLAFAAVEAVGGRGRTPCLIVAPIVGRTSMVLVMVLIPYARSRGMADGFTAAARSWIGATALVGGVGLCLLIAAAGGAVMLLAGAGTAACVAAFSLARVGGITGDVIGAACELAQVGALLAGGALPAAGWARPWW